jgi:hypothetical protein
MKIFLTSGATDNQLSRISCQSRPDRHAAARFGNEQRGLGLALPRKQVAA